MAPDGPYASIGKSWDEFADAAADWQVLLLRRTAARLADQLDFACMKEVEGARPWRRDTSKGRFN